MHKIMKKFFAFFLTVAMFLQIGLPNYALAHTDNTVSTTEDSRKADESLATDESPKIDESLNKEIPLIKSERSLTTEESKINKKVDLTFVIDSTGSMSDAISNVKDNITVFAKYLEDKGLTLRIGVVEYRDITCDGMDSTKVHKYNYTTWHNNTSEMIETLGKISAGGGGDREETLVDALGYLVDDKTMLWSSDAYKFAVVLTDVDFKVDNRHGYTGMNEVIDQLVRRNINTSVISDNYYFNSFYKDLIEKTGGIFGNIYSYNFSDVLKQLADKVIGETLKKEKAIYVLPGYMGSKLYDEDDNEIWVNTDRITDDVVAYTLPLGKDSVLTQNSDGTGSRVHVDMSKDPYGTYDTYKNLVDTLKSQCGSEYDVVFFPYNWLGDLNESAQKLKEHIDTNGYKDIIFVTHSTGGLLASAFIGASRENKLKVDKAILIAAPLFGTYTALEPIETGKTADMDSMLAGAGVSSGPLGIKYKLIYSWVKAITKNSPTTYQLLPSIEYLKLMPQIYKNDFKGTPVISKDKYYSILNGSSNINSVLTNGDNTRSHKYFRDTILGDDVVDLWQGDVVGSLQEVDTLLLGSSYGNLTPAIAVYKEKLLGGTKLDDMLYKMDGDGTILNVSSFATAKRGAHVLNYKDYPGLSHGQLASDNGVISDIVSYINSGKEEEESLRLFAAEESGGMSDYVHMKVECDKNIELKILDSIGNVVASVTNVSGTIAYEGATVPWFDIDITGFDGKRFIYMPLSSEAEGMDAVIYIPKGGYKVVFNYGNVSGTAINFNCSLSTLDNNGFKTATALYQVPYTKSDGHILSLDMISNIPSYENVDVLGDGETSIKTLFNTGWELNALTQLNNLGDTADIGVIGMTEEEKAKLSWSSSDESIVTVSDTGKVTAVGYGTATIAATDGNKASTCEVLVVKKSESVKLDDIAMEVGEKLLVKPVFTPSDTTETYMQYEYDLSAGIISIDEFGVITALKEGSLKVTGINPSGLKDDFIVTVSNSGIISVQSVTIMAHEFILSKGGTLDLTADITPSNATDKGVTWYIEDTNIVTITSDGLKCTATGIKEGETKLTVVTSDGGYTASVMLKVTPTPTPPVTPPVTPTPSVTPTPPTPPVNPPSAPEITPAIPTIAPTPAPEKSQLDIDVAKKNTHKTARAEAKLTQNQSIPVMDISFPKDSILKLVEDLEATKKEPALISFLIPETKTVELLKDEKVNAIDINITIPEDILKKDTIRINNLMLTKNVLKTVRKEGKTVSVSIKDDTGKLLYQWIFDGEYFKNSTKKITDINLVINVLSIQEVNKDYFKKDTKNKQGIAIRFNHKDKLPNQVDVRIYIGEQQGIQSESSLYVYRYNKDTGKLETLKGSTGYKMSKEGYLNLSVCDFNDYYILPKAAESSVVTPMLDQIKITLQKNTLYLSEKFDSSKLLVTMPDSILWVESLKNNKAPSGTAAVTFSFRSSNDAVASVDKNGLIIAVGEGKATIIVKVKLYNGEAKFVKLKIYVKKEIKNKKKE